MNKALKFGVGIVLVAVTGVIAIVIKDFFEIEASLKEIEEEDDDDDYDEQSEDWKKDIKDIEKDFDAN